MGVDDIELTTTVPVPQQRAFAAFTDGIAGWWLPEFTWSGPLALDTIGIEPREGGLCYEIGPHGFRCDWGRVLAWEAPRRAVITWQISPQRVPEPDPGKASRVEVTFHPDDAGGTRVTLRHHEFGRHGDGAGDYRDAMRAGWSQLLERYTAACG